MKQLSIVFFTIVFALSVYSSDGKKSVTVVWQQLDTGLDFAVFDAQEKSSKGDSKIRILRINPHYYTLRLCNISEHGASRGLTPKQWSKKEGLVAAINASMYQTDYKTSVSLMIKANHVNNRYLSKDKTILAFDRLSDNVPLVKIIDTQCEDFSVWRKRYGTLIQSIRMISCAGKNVWTQQPHKKSSLAAIGTDQDGNVFFIHIRSLYTTHDAIAMLKEIPLAIDRAMYAEGGPQAQLYINSGNNEFELSGMLENEPDAAAHSFFVWPIPNVIGVVKKK